MKVVFSFARAVAALFLAAALTLGTPASIGTAGSQRYLSDIKILTQDKMEGRGDGTKGLVRAEHFLEARYKSLGLEPAGTHGFLQPFVVTTGAKLNGKNHFVIQNARSKTELKLNQDYVPLSFSQSGAASAPLMFAGYGATAEEFGYDDYAGIDVKDKIAVVLRYEPGTFAAKSGNQGLTHHAQLITKAINARNHGAKGLIRPGNLEIWVTNAGGSNKREVTRNSAANFAPYWFPDGKRIIFASNQADPKNGRDFDLYVINEDGTGQERITFHPAFDAFPMFTSDGKRLVWASNRNGKAPHETNIFIADWVE